MPLTAKSPAQMLHKALNIQREQWLAAQAQHTSDDSGQPHSTGPITGIHTQVMNVHCGFVLRSLQCECWQL